MVDLSRNCFDARYLSREILANAIQGVTLAVNLGKIQCFKSHFGVSFLPGSAASWASPKSAEPLSPDGSPGAYGWSLCLQLASVVLPSAGPHCRAAVFRKLLRMSITTRTAYLINYLLWLAAQDEK
jgi:hypothetical protein